MYASYGEVVINTIPVAANQAILAIIPSDSIDLNYLYYALLSMKPKLRKYLRQTTQKNLNAHIVRNLEIPVPPPSEQKQISRILSTLDERTSSEEKCLYSLGQLKKGLMQVLLTGKVRVGA
jgi:type I restriction enzyme S subunit